MESPEYSFQVLVGVGIALGLAGLLLGWLAGKRSAVLLANHGPVVAGKDLWAAAFAVEELEEAAKLTLLTRGLAPRELGRKEVAAVVDGFDVDW